MTREEKLIKAYSEEALRRYREEEDRIKAEREFLEAHQKLLDDARRDEHERLTYGQRLKAS